MSSSGPSASGHRDSPRRFYGRRKGPRLTERRQALLDQMLPLVAIDPVAAADPKALFDPPVKALWLEIGFGKGEHLAWQARRHPQIGFIGCDPFLNGVAGLLAEMDEQGLDNVRIWPDDARDLLDRLPAASVQRVFLLHPDPWPKFRHRDRRFINPAPLDQVARVLERGGEFRVSTDDPVYRAWTAIQMAQRDDFEWTATGPGDWRTPPPDWTETRYARKAAQAGRAPVYFRYRRV